MIYLIEYDRKKGKLVTFKSFDTSQRDSANEERLSLEIDLNRRGVVREVVLLEAQDEAQLRFTHARYFTDARELWKSLRDQLILESAR